LKTVDETFLLRDKYRFKVSNHTLHNKYKDPVYIYNKLTRIYDKDKEVVCYNNSDMLEDGFPSFKDAMDYFNNCLGDYKILIGLKKYKNKLLFILVNSIPVNNWGVGIKSYNLIVIEREIVE
jgi:hypothetical protein